MKRALVLAGGGSRGAFQAGVWKYLSERGWKPDIICGTSVGAINAAAIISGLDAEKLIRLWTTQGHRQMYKLKGLPFLSQMVQRKRLTALFDTRKMQEVIAENLNVEVLQSNPTRLVISAVNILTGKPHFFTNEDIRLEHILASSAMPVLFPWHEIEGTPFWDGGTMANIPLQPALDFGAKEILVVFLSPVGHTPQSFPRTVRSALEHVFEQFISSSYQATLYSQKYQDQPLPPVQSKYTKKYNHQAPEIGQPNIITLAPSKMLGFRSLINFSLPQARQLINEGYTTALNNLKPFI